uniref:Uncharacterized protein n=1 Tax=Myoviridae sp. ctRbn2 TaxID=2825104 RepID=A0A8S5PX50_9CAUD|nr:MAG TPA: hypothetical protein [Myoviridae sp. ctRbn2]
MRCVPAIACTKFLASMRNFRNSIIQMCSHTS